MSSTSRTRLLSAIVLILFGIGSGIVARAQSNPDLTGTWVLDESKSDPGAAAAAAGGRGRGGAGAPAGPGAPDAAAAPGARGGGGAGSQLVIRQMDNQLSVTRGTQTFAYNLDGSEAPGPPGGETFSKIAWEGGKLTVTWRRQYYAGAQGYLTNTGRDVYTLSGTTLTVERTTSNAGSPSKTVKFVYSKS